MHNIVLKAIVNSIIKHMKLQINYDLLLNSPDRFFIHEMFYIRNTNYILSTIGNYSQLVSIWL